MITFLGQMWGSSYRSIPLVCSEDQNNSPVRLSFRIIGAVFNQFFGISNGKSNATYTIDTKCALIELLKIVGISAQPKSNEKYIHV